MSKLTTSNKVAIGVAIIGGIFTISAAILPKYMEKHDGGIADNTANEADKAAIQDVVKQSQLLETLTWYGKPQDFSQSQMDKYWLPADKGGIDRARIVGNIENLNQKKLHYAPSSQCTLFEIPIADIEIIKANERAQSLTHEEWKLNIADVSGKLVKQRIVKTRGIYKLRKVGGAWYIESANNPGHN